MVAVANEVAGQLWLALGRVDGLGVRSAQKLVEHFGSPDAVYGASISALEGAGLKHAVAERIRSGAGLREAEREVAGAEKLDCRLIPFGSSEYPPLLKQIADPPLVLYVRGDWTLLVRHAMAMVGTRRPTAYGSSVAHRLACDLAQRQLVVVSGLARGVDSAAHRGALEAKGKTVAVLGSGVDVIYPRENKKLAENILAEGAVISEFPLGTAPRRRISPSATGLSADFRSEWWLWRRPSTADR